jgi:hypothetical protein
MRTVDGLAVHALGKAEGAVPERTVFYELQQLERGSIDLPYMRQ